MGWVSLGRFRKQLVVGNGLHAHDGGDAKDVMGIGAARDISGRTVEAQKDLAIRIGASDMAQQFTRDVP